MIGTQFFHQVLNILDRQVHLWCGLDQCGHSVLLPRMVQGQHYTTFRILVVVLEKTCMQFPTASCPELLRQRGACWDCWCRPGAGAVDETPPNCHTPWWGSRRRWVRAAEGDRDAVEACAAWCGRAGSAVDRL